MESLDSKKDYLNDKEVKDFVSFLSRLIGNDFSPDSFSLKSAYKSLGGALNLYKWPDNKNGLNFANTKAKLDQLEVELQSSVDSKDKFGVFKACVRILQWGGVGAGIQGVALLYCDDNLIEALNSAISILNSESIDYSVFDKKLRMNSSFTKIYSLLSKEPFIIYDSRVAGALALIIREYWKANRVNCNFSEKLAFAIPEDRSTVNRNPSDKDSNIIFKNTKSVTNKDALHAKWNVRANWLLEASILEHNSKLSEIEVRNKMREIEAALFMIGYEV